MGRLSDFPIHSQPRPSTTISSPSNSNPVVPLPNFESIHRFFLAPFGHRQRHFYDGSAASSAATAQNGARGSHCDGWRAPGKVQIGAQIIGNGRRENFKEPEKVQKIDSSEKIQILIFRFRDCLSSAKCGIRGWRGGRESDCWGPEFEVRNFLGFFFERNPFLASIPTWKCSRNWRHQRPPNRTQNRRWCWICWAPNAHISTTWTLGRRLIFYLRKNRIENGFFLGA